MLIRVDDVYAVLRSDQPLKPTRAIALSLLDEALSTISGSSYSAGQKAGAIEKAQAAIAELPNGDCEGTGNDASEPIMISRVEAWGLLQHESPKRADNQAAVALLRAVDLLASVDARKAVSRLQPVIDGVRSALDKIPAEVLAEARLMTAIQILKAEITTLGSTVAELSSGHPVVQEQDASKLVEAIVEHERSKWSDDSLSTAIDLYKANVIDKSDVSLKHKEDISKRLLTFLTFMTDRPIRDINREDLRDYRDHLDKLPDRSELRFKTYDIRQAIALNAKLVVPFSSIGPVTVNLKYLGPVRRLFAWYLGEGKLERNPTDDIHSGNKEKEGDKKKRFPLKPDQISRLFSVTARAPRVNSLYWIPPLLLFTGARLNELAQLRTDDLRTFNGRLHLSVLCLEDDGAENEDEAPKRPKHGDHKRNVKSPAARRLIPLHKEILLMGFPEFVRSQRSRRKSDGQLFGDLKPDRFGMWSAAISKRINRRLRALKITNPRLSAYSLRHNFRDGCVENKITREARMKFMGHQLEGMDGVYGNPHPLQFESDEIDLLVFPNVDLSPYKGGRGRTDRATG